ncbi:MAG TPA: ABC transporter permease, partial [bacterium]|nr:ABC transporter permease [bacterium]
MLRFFFKRILLLLPLYLGITLLTFLILHLSPGGPETTLEFSQKMSPEVREKIRRIYGLDEPVLVQYFRWMKRFAVLDFGNSFQDGRPVIKKIAEKVPATLLLNFLSLFAVLFFAVPLGVFSALRRGRLADRLITVFVFIGFSLPLYWIALTLQDLLGVRWNILPLTGMKSFLWDKYPLWKKLLDLIWHLILPVSVLTFVGLAGITRYMRN